MGRDDYFAGKYEGLKQCPKCHAPMSEAPQPPMTEGQEADYEMGFNIPLYCPRCNASGVYDISEHGGDPDFEEFDDFVLSAALATTTTVPEFKDELEKEIKQQAQVDVDALLAAEHFAEAVIHLVVEVKYSLQLNLLFEAADNPNDKLTLALLKCSREKDIFKIAKQFGVIDRKQCNFLYHDLMNLRNIVAHERLKKEELEQRFKLSEVVSQTKELIEMFSEWKGENSNG